MKRIIFVHDKLSEIPTLDWRDVIIEVEECQVEHYCVYYASIQTITNTSLHPRNSSRNTYALYTGSLPLMYFVLAFHSS